MFNQTEKRVMEKLDRQFRFAWLKALSEEDGAPVIAGLAQMLEFEDTWELALDELRKRVDQYPKSVAQQVIFSLRRNDNQRRYQISLHALKLVPKADLSSALRNARQLEDGERLVRKLRRDLKNL